MIPKTRGNVFTVPGPKAKEEVLSGASDWKIQFDIDVTDLSLIHI